MRARRTDANHAAVIHTLEALYCSVVDTSALGGGFPDLVVGLAGTTVLVEVKAENGTLQPNQQRFHDDWRGRKPVIVRTQQDCIDLVCMTMARKGA